MGFNPKQFLCIINTTSSDGDEQHLEDPISILASTGLKQVGT